METLDTASLDGGVRRPQSRLALVIAWCRAEPHRVGEVLVVTGGQTIGRGEDAARWMRQRPGRDEERPALESRGLSRQQLRVSIDGAGLLLENLGRRRLLVGGAEARRAVLAPGQTAQLENELVLLATRRPPTLSPARAWDEDDSPRFGAADRFGVVGESPAAWALRDELAFAARRSLHVLLLGPTGTGKELAARAIHAMSHTDRPLVARNAATLPSGLIEAELFGNVRDYPNPGMPEREGLVGAADGSVLFLDEIGELPEDQQARLLRVLDDDGEYHRLGEDRARRSRLRLVGATNRSVARIKHDLLARLALRVELPPLAERREDVPLLARHLVLGMAEDDPDVRRRFVEDTEDGPAPRLLPELVEALLAAELPHGVRELRALLWESVRQSEGEWLAPSRTRASPVVESDAVEPGELGEAEVRAALETHGWNVSRAYRALGLRSRHVLHRLMRKHGIERD